MHLPTYDRRRSYRWNYDHPPTAATVPELPSTNQPAPQHDGVQWHFCGLPIASPLGIAAGPLLNGKWLLYYAQLGFDVLTYKTVRSRDRECYSLPNLQPIQQEQEETGEVVDATEDRRESWAISFGMPSMTPDVWRKDIAWTREQLPESKVLSVSVVATAAPDWSMEQVAEDYARCAQWAVESGADTIELNLSCPNVSSVDGQLYQNLDSTRLVLETVREKVPTQPLIVKIGYVGSQSEAESFIQATDGLVTAIAMTNCLACRVRSGDNYLFDGQPRGIGGQAIRAASVEQVRMFAGKLLELNSATLLIGVGGISAAEHVQQYLQAGAHHVHLATAPMLDPEVGLRIRSTLPAKQPHSRVAAE